MYISHRHHTSNGVAALPTTLIFTLVCFCAILLFSKMGPSPLNMHIIFRVEWKLNDSCYHCITNKLLTIYLQPLQKKYNNKRRSRKSLVCSHRRLWETLHSFIVYQFVVFMTDQCDQRDSAIEENDKESSFWFWLAAFNISFMSEWNRS